MTTPSEIALSYQLALTNQLDITANNIANTDTPGFQSSHPLFVEYLVKLDDGQEVTYVEDAGMVRNLNPGHLNFTGNRLDVGIQGNGYFAVESDGQVFYTRNGAFRLNSEGQLITSRGAAVLDDRNQPIVLAETDVDIEITRDGVINGPNGQIGRIGLFTFDNQQNMRPVGNSLLATDELPVAAAEAEVVQGMMEASNVLAIAEVTRMIELLRSYQSANRMIVAEDERERKAIETLTQIV